MDAPGTEVLIALIAGVSGAAIAAFQWARKRLEVQARRAPAEVESDALRRLDVLEAREEDKRFAAIEERLARVERRVDRRELVCEVNHGPGARLGE